MALTFFYRCRHSDRKWNVFMGRKRQNHSSRVRLYKYFDGKPSVLCRINAELFFKNALMFYYVLIFALSFGLPLQNTNLKTGKSSDNKYKFKSISKYPKRIGIYNFIHYLKCILFLSV